MVTRKFEVWGRFYKLLGPGVPIWAKTSCDIMTSHGVPLSPLPEAFWSLRNDSGDPKLKRGICFPLFI
jgi:hypothetical protein